MPTRSPKRPTTGSPPELPAALRDPPDLTVALEFRDDAAPPTVQLKTVTRTARLVHIRLASADNEWLFVRNPVDVRRASGTLIDHRHRAIINYEESELRMSHVARGWADIVGFGVPPEIIATWQTSGERDTVGGFDFEEARAPSKPEHGVTSVWWSHAAAAPLRISLAGGSEIVARSIVTAVDEAVLMPPERRFPEYRVFDVADYREQHHEMTSGKGESAPH